MLDRAIELADGDTSIGAGIALGCPYAHCLIFKGGYSINLGRLEEARRLIEGGMKLAGEQGDVEVVGWGHMWSCLLAQFAGHPEAMLNHAQQSLEIAERIGDSFSRSWAWTFLGSAERAQGRWASAIEALERSREISRKQRTAMEAEPQRLGLLAESLIGFGDAERAREVAAEGIEIARAQGNVQGETAASLAQARVLIGAEDIAARDEIEAALKRVLELATRTGAKVYEPQVHVELAELARLSGDEKAWQEELSEARRLFSEIGSSGFAEQMADALALSSG